MSHSAFGAFHPADAEADSPGGELDGSFVITMDGEAGRVAAGTAQLMKL